MCVFVCVCVFKLVHLNTQLSFSFQQDSLKAKEEQEDERGQ